jgi:tRNA (guanine37-N1)-methyltransferase
MWQASLLTLFPDMFPGPLGASLTGKALDSGLWSLDAIDIRSYARDKHRSVDDTPAGGGPGMVMRADVLAAAFDGAIGGDDPRPRYYLSPRGMPVSQDKVRNLAGGTGLVLLCGRFEGVDERILEARKFEELSIGDLVLSGGEIAAMALIEACVRLLPGVLGSDLSVQSETFEDGLLEYPHYTRPRSWEGLDIPDILLSGDHDKIARWRRHQALELTRARRPDLLAGKTGKE